MDFNLVATLIVILSSVESIRTSKTGGNDVGLLKQSMQKVPTDQCFPLGLLQEKYRDLHEFSSSFAEMVAGLQKVNTSSSGDVIMFVGNTGVGKSCLVHLLAGHTDQFTAVEDIPDSNNFYILDTTGKKVSNITTESKTTYPEAILDVRCGVIFFDTPGFRDTRSAIHEVIAAYGLQAVAKSSKRIKFAVLVNYDSLTVGGSRDDFLNTLQSFYSLLKNPNKYRNSTYLVATKVKNDIIVRNREYRLVSYETYVNGTVKFLEGVDESLRNQQNKTGGYFDKQFLSFSQYFIGDLVANRKKISLFKKPDQKGPVMKSEPVQQSIEKIRQSLLATDGYANVGVNDFGITLSDKAKFYIHHLFYQMNNYTIDVSKSLIQAFESSLVAKYENSSELRVIVASLEKAKHDVGVLVHSVNISHHPHEVADALQRFLYDVGVNTCSNDAFQEMKQLSYSLSGLESVGGGGSYAIDRWVASLYDFEHIVKNELDIYIMLGVLFEKLTDYSAFNAGFYRGISSVLSRHNKRHKIVTKHNFVPLMQHLALNQYAGLEINEYHLNEINSMYVKAKENIQYRAYFCWDNMLVIVGDFLLLKVLSENRMCPDAKTVALLATNRIYIDTNVGVDVLDGRNLVVIAPEWHVLGKFVISVNGASQGAAQHKAPKGQVGVAGKPGQSAGNFIGVGLHYVNSHQLTITANGGNGQNGQDGGDGTDGKDGSDDGVKKLIDENRYGMIFRTIKKTYLIEADKGTRGSDAGMGGAGGAGGLKGRIEMHSLRPQIPHRSKLVMLNGAGGKHGASGIPGRGGIRGCDTLIRETTFINVAYWEQYDTKRDLINCNNRRNPNGKVVSKVAGFREKPSGVAAPPSICKLYAKMADRFESDKFYNNFIDEFQHTFNNRFHCKV